MRPGSKERRALKKALEECQAQQVDIPMYIGRRRSSERKISKGYLHRMITSAPWDIFTKGTGNMSHKPLTLLLAAKPLWSNLSWESRASNFSKSGRFACRTLSL